jgi:hypothetical protein
MITEEATMKLTASGYIYPGTLEVGDRVTYIRYGQTKKATVVRAPTTDAYAFVENDEYGHPLGANIGRYDHVYSGDLRGLVEG